MEAILMQWQRRIKRSAVRCVYLVAVLLSAGCAAPAVVATVALDGIERGAMRQQLTQAMRGYGLVAPDAEAVPVAASAPPLAQWRLEVLEFSEDRRVLRISRQNREAEVLLRGKLRVRIGHLDGDNSEPAIIRQYRAQRRQVLLRPDSDAAQERQLRAELRAELAARAAADARWAVDGIE